MVEVRATARDDLPALIELLEEMGRFYGATDAEPTDIALDRAREALFGHVPAARALVASDAGSLVGFAAYSFSWPAIGLTRAVFLKVLYVAESARRQGVGRLLMRHLGRVAHEAGCSRAEWTVDNDNKQAQAFYESLGASLNTGKLSYRVQGAEQIALLKEL